MKKVPDPNPAGQKSTDPTGSGSSSLVLILLRVRSTAAHLSLQIWFMHHLRVAMFSASAVPYALHIFLLTIIETGIVQTSK